MDDHSIWMIVAIVLLLLLSGFFSATETAFTSVNRIKIKNMAGDGDARAARVLSLIEKYDTILSTILVGNNIVNIAMTSIATVLFISLFRSNGPVIATVVITVIVLIFGEISPKSLAKDNAESFAMFAAPILKAFVVVLTPLNFLFGLWRKLLSKVFKTKGNNIYTDDELLTIVEEAESVGSLDENESQLIQNAIEFKDVEAEEVMTPRVDIVAIDLTATDDEILELFKTTGFSRLPVYDDDMDDIKGILNQKDFYNEIYGTGKDFKEVIKPVVFVAASIKIANLLKRMQVMQSHMAVVVDEYGGTEGIVTMEDIIEELVGEIYDEHDVIMSQEVTELNNGSYRVMCNASLSKVMDYFDVDEEIDANTVNGWVVLCLDKLPAKGDTFECELEGKLFKGRVTKATEKKALEINLVVSKANDEEKPTE